MTDCTIIGAGISGLLAARVLSDAGYSVRILEKSRGLGGRMATRRRDQAVFDHGAQFFTVRDGRFRRWVDQWLEAGLVETWYELGDSGLHYRAAPSMTGIAKHLAATLDVEREVKIEQALFEPSDGSWTLNSDTGARHRSSSVIFTAPVPQSLALLDRGGFQLPAQADQQLRSIQFHRCIAAMVVLDRPSAIRMNRGAIKLDSEPIQWMADNQRKGISPAACAITIHSTPAFADEHWDSPDSERLPILLEAARPHFGDARVVSVDGHRWGFSQPMAAFESDSFCDPAHRLAIAGDGLAGGRVEGAAISGLSAAEAIQKTLAG